MTGTHGKTIKISGYYQQDSEEMERLKLQILKTIARNDIRVLNLQSFQFMIDDLKFK